MRELTSEVELVVGLEGRKVVGKGCLREAKLDMEWVLLTAPELALVKEKKREMV